MITIQRQNEAARGRCCYTHFVSKRNAVRKCHQQAPGYTIIIQLLSIEMQTQTVLLLLVCEESRLSNELPFGIEALQEQMFTGVPTSRTKKQVHAYRQRTQAHMKNVVQHAPGVYAVSPLAMLLQRAIVVCEKADRALSCRCHITDTDPRHASTAPSLYASFVATASRLHLQR